MRRTTSKVWDFMKVLGLFAAVAGLSAFLADFSSDEFAGYARVIDGDSLHIGEREIRLFGIDAPEFSQTCQRNDHDQSFACGREALAHLQRLIAGKDVYCNGWERDKYNRLLAICSVENLNLNEAMVLSGWAVAFGDYEALERQARQSRRGLWDTDFLPPSQWRKETREARTEGLFQALKFW